MFPRNPQALLGAIIIQDVISSPTSRIPDGQHRQFEELMPPPSCLVPNWRPGDIRSPRIRSWGRTAPCHQRPELTLQTTFYARVNKRIQNQSPIRTGTHAPSFNRKHRPRLSQPMLKSCRGSPQPTLTQREERPQISPRFFLPK